MSNRQSIAIVAAALVISLAVVLRPLEARGPAMIAAERIATVDMGKVLDRLNEAAEWDMKIDRLSANIGQEFQRRQEALQSRIAELREMPESDDSAALREEVALMRLRFEEWGRLKQLELDRERSLKWQTLYRAIREEVARLAQSEGFELVVVNDGVGPISVSRELEMSQERQVRMQIEGRQILFAADATDITEQLVVRMNNARAVRP
ncbi:MAG: OmpH family outer membrane protein [Phycisphaerales bacterium]|jgi:Skp family chaperone for outer membrane proteins|nr:OmpH family outer membrane protein [Planctomycetota bacterium]